MYYVSRIAALIAAVLGVVVLITAGWFSIRLARADALFRSRDPQSVARATVLAPGNTDYLSFHALQIEYEGGDPSPVLEKIAALNPFASAPRIRLGLAAELRGDFDTAAKWLLDAARVDHQFEPRWTLANFYFRRQDAHQFWTWMRSALEISYGDRRPAFDLCWRVSSSPPEILAAIPEQHDVIAAYLAYLLDTKRTDAILPVALKLAAASVPDDRPLLLAACDAFLEQSDAASARTLWTRLGYNTPSGILNENFEPPRVGHGFDWRISEIPGVSHVALDSPAAHRVTLSGHQPESCELLRQIVNLKAGARYTLRWEARTVGLATPTGLEWRIADQHGSIPSSEDWHAGEMTFTAPSELITLSLNYQRPSGQARAEGSVEVWKVQITFIHVH